MKRIDAHCHLFNLWYLLSELITIGWDATLGGGYPRRLRERGGLRDIGPKKGQEAESDFEKILDFLLSLLRQAVQVSFSMFNSYQDNYELLKHEYLAVHPSETDLYAVPLMMDIYFMLDGYFGPPGGTRTMKAANPEKAFAEWYGKAKRLIREELDGRRVRTLSLEKDGLVDLDQGELENKLDEFVEGLKATRGGGLKLGAERGFTNTVMTPGFEKEIHDSIKLWKDKDNRGKVFPFLAVDPRREGIMDLVKAKNVFDVDGPLVSHKGPFYGIKLYPRLGYLPKTLDEPRYGLYAWCAQNDIPITFHCNTGGFPTLPGWKWRDYSDPGNWEGILKDYKDVNGGLRLNCAHFGAGDPVWRKKIMDYASNSGGAYGSKVYTDVACYVNQEPLKKAVEDYAATPAMRGKLQFGTDYDVMLLTGLADLQKYFKQFDAAFKADGFDYLAETMEKAPRDFLAAEDMGE